MEITAETVDHKFNLIARNTQEIIGEEDLKILIQSENLIIKFIGGLVRPVSLISVIVYHSKRFWI